MTPPPVLSHAWPRMGSDAEAATRARLGAPCGCGAAFATLRRRLLPRGVVTVCVQCDGCGRQIGGPMLRASHFNWQSYAEWDQSLRDAAGEREQAEREREQEQRELRHAAWRGEAPLRSAAYLQSLDCAEWRDLRSRVLARDRHTCQACLTASAEEVHHIRYAETWPMWRVPAWHLVSICRACHAAQHEGNG